MPIEAVKKATRFALSDGGSIKARVLRSAVWVGISEGGLAVLGVVRSVALARLLTPEMFGLMGLAMIVIRAIETLTRPGIGQALIAQQQEFEKASATGFTMLLGRGVLLAILLALAAPWISRFYEAEALERMLQVLSLVFLIGGFASINTIAHQRDLEFRKLTYLAQVTNLVGTLATIAAAYWWRNVWALVLGQLVTVTLNTVLSYWFVGGRIRFAYDREVAADLLRYGKFITGSSIVLYVATEIDSAVIGKVLGTETLGFYTLAYMIAFLATANPSKVASSIMMPAYSRLQSDLPALRNAFLRTLTLVMLLVLPAAAGLIVVAGPLIHVVYGEKWMGATLPLQLLALFGTFRALAAFNGYLFEGVGKPKVAFQLGLVRLAFVLPLIVPLTTRYGLPGTAITVTIGMASQWLAGLPSVCRHLQIGIRDLLGSFWRPLWTSLAMAAAVAALGTVVARHTILGLSATVLCGVVVYGALNLRFLLQLKRERLG